MLDIGGGSMQLVHVAAPARPRARLLAARRGAHDRALPRRRQARQAQAAARAAGVRRRRARARTMAEAVGRRGSSGSAARCATSPPPPSARPTSPSSACRASSSRATRSTRSSRSSPTCRPSERGRVPGIKPGRADIILGGALVVQAVMEEGGFEAIDVTEAGLREGVFFERYLARRNGGEALFDDVRRASVVNLAAQYGMSPDLNPHVAHVARLALELFDELAAAGLHPGDSVERELLWAAALLHDIGMTSTTTTTTSTRATSSSTRGLPGYAPARGRAHRPGGPLPPQGHAVARRRSPRSRTRATRSGLRPDVRAAAPRRGPRAQPRPARPRGARRGRTTARCAWTSCPTATRASRAGPPAARASCSSARSGAGSRSARSAARSRARAPGRPGSRAARPAP